MGSREREGSGIGRDGSRRCERSGLGGRKAV